MVGTTLIQVQWQASTWDQKRAAENFVGMARLSGPLPGGAVRNLALPVKGMRSPASGLAVWRECTPVGFDSLAIAGLTLDRIFTEMPTVPFRDHVWPKFLRENAERVFGGAPHPYPS